MKWHNTEDKLPEIEQVVIGKFGSQTMITWIPKILSSIDIKKPGALHNKWKGLYKSKLTNEEIQISFGAQPDYWLSIEDIIDNIKI